MVSCGAGGVRPSILNMLWMAIFPKILISLQRTEERSIADQAWAEVKPKEAAHVYLALPQKAFSLPYPSRCSMKSR